jgi:hypothetical protein
MPMRRPVGSSMVAFGPLSEVGPATKTTEVRQDPTALKLTDMVRRIGGTKPRPA